MAAELACPQNRAQFVDNPDNGLVRHVWRPARVTNSIAGAKSPSLYESRSPPKSRQCGTSPGSIAVRSLHRKNTIDQLRTRLNTSANNFRYVEIMLLCR